MNMMTNTSNKQLAAKASGVHAQLKDALSWVSASVNPEVSQNNRLLKDLRRSVFQARRLESAAQAKMCVGVYGASQAGKSYLVSILARRGGERLIAMLGGHEVDFIQHINPEGGKESTGLVTRFTIDTIQTPDGYPIQAKLLGEFDLIKLFVNSYANDILPSEDEDIQDHQNHVLRVLDELDKLPRASSPIAIEDVFDLEDYCNTRFISNLRMQALKKADFWSRAAELLPNLGDAGRQKVVELLWEAIPAYSQMYALLVGELSRIGHPKVIFCAPSALFDVSSGQWSRSDQSIINVSSLEGLGNPNDPRVQIANSSGQNSDMARANLCALISELVIPIKDRPHAFFDSTDLLDFPGARSRKGQPKNNEALKSSAVQVENFLRGKVAYLFDKYSADLELSAMLLCVGPSNQEVVGLDQLVEDWIMQTHGVRPEDRDKLETALFLVLTKMDQEFSQGAGKSIDGTRWTTRLQASLIKPFAAHSHRTNWVNKWDSNGAFRNAFWLRNPNADQAGLIDYEGIPGSSPETGYSKAKAELIGVLRQAFLDNELVKSHFENPPQAWDAGMSLNDGGASYLITQLAKICKPDVKIKQVDERLNALLSQREADLRKYYISGNVEDVIKEKRELAYEFLRSGALLIQKQRLGEFVGFLLASDSEAKDIFDRVEHQFVRQKHSKRESGQDLTPPVSEIDHDLARSLGLPVEEPEAVQQTPASNSNQATASFHELFITNFLQEWHVSVLSRAGSNNAANYLFLNRELLVKLLHEFEFAAKRIGLVENLKKLVESNYQFKSDKRKAWVWKQTSGVTALFNEFIVRGGCEPTHRSKPQQIEGFDGKQIMVFEPVPEMLGDMNLPDVQEDFSRKYLLDWMNAMQFTIRSNATFVAGATADLESNRILGALLDRMNTLTAIGH